MEPISTVAPAPVLNLVIISGFASATMADPRTGVRCWPALWRPEPRASSRGLHLATRL
jgi:hypothetical protein